MKTQRKINALFLFLFAAAEALTGQSVNPQDTVETEIAFRVFASETQVPVNRQIELIYQLSQSGDFDIEMGPINDPVLTQFTIAGVTSSNKVIGTAAGKKVVKEIGYILQPEIEGMGYIEPIAISYVDKATGKTHYLSAQRFGVEILSPVKEEGEQSLVWIWTAGFLLMCGIGLALFVFARKRSVQKEFSEPEQILEESCLAELKSTVSLDGPDYQGGFAALSRLMRHYLSKKYDVPALELTTEDLTAQLKEIESLSTVTDKLASIFKQTDIIKFSGQQTTAAELGAAYTVFETLLEDNLKIEMEQQNQNKPQKKRFGRSQANG